MIRLAFKTLRFHKGGFLATFIALFFGAAIVVGCGGLFETGLHKAAPPQRLAAAPLLITGDQRFPDTRRDIFPERVRLDRTLADRVKAVPGVSAVVPDVSFPLATLDGGHPGAQLTGHGWSSARLAPYRTTEGTAPTGAREIAVDTRFAAEHGVRVGRTVRLTVRGEAGAYRVTALVSGTGDPATVFLTDAAADRATGRPGTPDALGVFTAPGADTATVHQAVTKAVAGTERAPGIAPPQVLTGDERGWAEHPEVIAEGSKLVTLASVFGGLSAAVTVFVVSSTVGLSLNQRQRESALLRAIGATPAQLRRMVLGETLVVAVVATALATFPGPAIGRVLLSAFASAGVVPETIAFRAGFVPVAIGVATALLTALGAAFLGARAATRTRPTEALAEASLQRRWFSAPRLVFALLFLAGGTTLALVTAGVDGPTAGSTATPAAMLWTAGFGLLGPGLAKLITAALRGPLRAFTGLAGSLATLNAKARTSRFAGAVMPVMLASGLAMALIYLQTTQSSGAERAFREDLRADLVVTSADGSLPLDLVRTVARQPGVAAASAQISTLGYLDPPVPKPEPGDEPDSPNPEKVPLQGVTPDGLGRTTAYRAATGDLAALTGESVALPTTMVTEGGYKLGDRVPMRLGDGTPVRLTLVATLDGRRGYETALLPAALLAPHTGTGLLPQIMVKAAPGTDPAKLTGTLSALAKDHPGLRVADRDALAVARADADETQTWMSYLLLCMVVGYATIALVNTQVVATTERRREFMLQRLIGSTRRQVLQMMTVEAALVAIAGIVLGVLVAALTLVPLSISVLGSPIPDGSPWIFIGVVAAAVGLTLATTLLSARLVLRGKPGQMAGVRE
ncbi:FtsX-like permease family protein [Streptomyces catenulae]|uniref:FtsX-like permease family protein n=1 Tax=Streptomyces catenulae TaxID=66875 RepID=A0ABV2Z3X8_9ACTN|nr:FtsX-like permease family protein [Streptomyces catenulae]